jgi:NAD(P)-dependent dehydrogenase (short-subunit alcohol dehydrogenase family)
VTGYNQIYPWKSFEDTDYETWRKVIGVNLDGAFLMCKAFVPAMAAEVRHARTGSVNGLSADHLVQGGHTSKQPARAKAYPSS